MTSQPPHRFAALTLAFPLLIVLLHASGCTDSFDNCATAKICEALEGEAGSAGDAGSGGDSGSDCQGDSPATAPCLIDKAHGIFVAPQLDPAAGYGTPEEPYSTIAAALAAAPAKGKRNIYVCAERGVIRESLEIGAELSGVRIFGGFRCDAQGWTYDTTLRARIEAPSPLAVRIEDATDVVIEAFDIVAGNGSTAGESSVGVLAVSSTVRVKNGSITAGNGAPGADGKGDDTEASSGAPGKDGSNACAEAPVGGGTAATVCDGAVASTGGNGGPGAGANGAPGAPGVLGTPERDGTGQGGSGQPTTNSSAWNCTMGGGLAGANGTSPEPAAGGSGPGKLDRLGIHPAHGADGQHGSPGQGGGGGGGALAPNSATCGGTGLATGASGGSGGGGGCGGKGGTGGKGGGASIAFASVDSTVTLDRVQLTAGMGGKGGKGGPGQPGGRGGQAGKGGEGNNSLDGCPGGQGGTGGHGAPGGGGAGGASIALAYLGAEPSWTGDDELAKAPALGGADGEDGLAPPTAGSVGLVEKIVEFKQSE